MRVLGRGKTALAIKDIYPDAILYDDKNKEQYDINSDELTIVSPGIPPYNDLVQNTKNLQSDYDLLLTDDIFTVWISGTNGKTTTTQMCEWLLNKDGFKVAGNIGTALSSVSSDKLLLETSSFTLHYTTKAKPNIYVLLPISEDHISWHGSYEEYENTKLKPLSMMKQNDIAIVPYKYKDIKSKAKVYTYKDTTHLANQFNIDIAKINFEEPFLFDALLALVVEYIYTKNVSYEKINTFVQDAHRIEKCIDKYNRLWINDSKATNVDATIQALKPYKQFQIFLILGGDDKGANLIPLFEELKQYTLKIYAVGSNVNKLQKLCIEYNIEYEINNTIQNAVFNINDNSNFQTQNCVSILSPAASSLDQFSSYEQRGEIFKELITNLSNN